MGALRKTTCIFAFTYIYSNFFLRFIYVSFLIVSVTDASGRYNSQFFFGNDFWLGSHSLCNELQNTRTNKIVPPFKAEFHVAKLLVKMPDQLTPAVSISFLHQSSVVSASN